MTTLDAGATVGAMRALTLGMGTRAAAALALGWCLAHCKRRETHEAAPTTHAAQPSTATAAPAPAPAPAPAQTPSATPEAAAPVVDLLRATEAVVRVSSAVDNPNDRPERLVDGDPDTAWSSATGEMERTWMEVRLPPDARVERMEMTAGYTRAGGRTDLFTGNVRVARVRVLRDGAVVGEYPLDVASRALQPVPARGAGGLWRIETVGLVPGTRRAWREVTVSELRVMGVAGRTGLRATPAAPAVAVGPESPAGGAAPSAADGGSLSMALDAARRELLGEGLNLSRARRAAAADSPSTASIATGWPSPAAPWTTPSRDAPPSRDVTSTGATARSRVCKTASRPPSTGAKTTAPSAPAPTRPSTRSAPPQPTPPRPAPRPPASRPSRPSSAPATPPPSAVTASPPDGARRRSRTGHPTPRWAR
nr:hypothetical protein [Deltaproteobacteria bacterium]